MWTLCTAVLCRLLDTGTAVGWRTPVEAEKNEIVLQGWTKAGAGLAGAATARAVDLRRSHH